MNLGGEARHLGVHAFRENGELRRFDADAGLLHARENGGQRQIDGFVQLAQTVRLDFGKQLVEQRASSVGLLVRIAIEFAIELSLSQSLGRTTRRLGAQQERIEHQIVREAFSFDTEFGKRGQRGAGIVRGFHASRIFQQFANLANHRDIERPPLARPRGKSHGGHGQFAFAGGIDGDRDCRVSGQLGEPCAQVLGVLERCVIAFCRVLHRPQFPGQTEKLQVLIYLAKIVDVRLAGLQRFHRHLHGNRGVDSCQALA